MQSSVQYNLSCSLLFLEGIRLEEAEQSAAKKLPVPSEARWLWSTWLSKPLTSLSLNSSCDSKSLEIKTMLLKVWLYFSLQIVILTIKLQKISKNGLHSLKVIFSWWNPLVIDVFLSVAVKQRAPGRFGCHLQGDSAM